MPSSTDHGLPRNSAVGFLRHMPALPSIEYEFMSLMAPDGLLSRRFRV